MNVLKCTRKFENVYIIKVIANFLHLYHPMFYGDKSQIGNIVAFYTKKSCCIGCVERSFVMVKRSYIVTGYLTYIFRGQSPLYSQLQILTQDTHILSIMHGIILLSDLNYTYSDPPPFLHSQITGFNWAPITISSIYPLFLLSLALIPRPL